ncbi:MFS transporter [Corynebacterium sp. sy039]|nr:MFS transporter [Corynebacterium sp. sy039]
MCSWEGVGVNLLAKNPRFTSLTVANACNELSQALSFVAIPLGILTIGGSATSAGVVAFLSAACGIGFQFVSGAIVDRFNASVVLKVATAIQVLTWLVVALLFYAGTFNITIIGVAAVVASIAASVSSPCDNVLISRIVARDDLGAANTIVQGREACANLVGSPLGGLLVGWSLGVAMIVQSVFHGIALLLVPSVGSAVQEDSGEQDSGGQESVYGLWDGFRFVWKNPGLRAVVFVASLINLPLSMQPIVLFSHYEAVGVSSLLIGFYASAMGLGVVVGSVVGVKLLEKVSMGWVGIVTLLVLSLGFVFISVVYGSILFVGVVSFVSGLLLPVFNGAIGAYAMAVTPEHILARVVAATGIPGLVLSPLGPLLGGFLSDSYGVFFALCIAALLTFPPLVVAVLSKSFRGLPLIQEISRDS